MTERTKGDKTKKKTQYRLCQMSGWGRNVNRRQLDAEWLRDRQNKSTRDYTYVNAFDIT